MKTLTQWTELRIVYVYVYVYTCDWSTDHQEGRNLIRNIVVVGEVRHCNLDREGGAGTSECS